MKLKLDNKKLSKIKSQSAFSFVELMFSLMMLIIILVGLMYTYVVCFKLNNSSRELTLVNNALQAQLEFIKATDFTTLVTWAVTPKASLPPEALNFDLSGFSANDARGYYDFECMSGYDDCLLYIRLTACWRDGNNRIIGEDVNLDGVLEVAEDTDTDGVVDSPAELVTLVSRTE